MDSTPPSPTSGDMEGVEGIVDAIGDDAICQLEPLDDATPTAAAPAAAATAATTAGAGAVAACTGMRPAPPRTPHSRALAAWRACV